MSHATTRRKDRIAALNDAFRQGSSITITASIHSMPADDMNAIIRKVREFDDFTPGDNPHGEKDFGAFTHNWSLD